MSKGVTKALIYCWLLQLSFQALGSSLEEQRSRLLKQIVETQDEGVRAKLMEIYSSLEPARGSQYREEEEVRLVCSVQEKKESPTRVTTECRDSLGVGLGTKVLKDGRWECTGETVEVINTPKNQQRTLYLKPSEGVKGCEVGSYTLLDCSMTKDGYFFKYEYTGPFFIKSKDQIKIDRNTARFTSNRFIGDCQKVDKPKI